ncbi:protein DETOXIFICATION 46, chloroplastic [Beta vulgaris subsp. vulgaris]|uniref:protein DETOXIFICATION 46, chloroplastic n=1 Tax=Beta vulgaris subsp. vulgaris TaxID=3555 RepID=UPI002037160C|nr:protein DETOXIFICATION 46, chloroplastic [Beta vulgaris subsp. vulgaris]
MQFKAITSTSSHIQLKTSIIKQTIPCNSLNFNPSFSSHFWRPKTSQKPLNSPILKLYPTPKNLQKLGCISPSQQLLGENYETHQPEFENNGGGIDPENEKLEILEPTNEVEELGNQSMWDQMVDIVKFSGPATGLWICGPLMSLIDTAVIGQGSSLELAALGPGTVLCDYVGYVFMFLSIATSNLVATSLAQKDENQVQHQISILLCMGLASGVLMLLLTICFGEWALTAFVGLKNIHLVSAANSYVQIRALAWPAILVGSVAQSASLGMKDSLGPLKALLIASALNGIGDVVLCTFLGYGIAGAAWATAASQVVAAYAMIGALNKKGYNGFSFVFPSLSELQIIFEIAAPVFITMVSKVAFYVLIIYIATSMGTHVVAAHQVLLNIYSMCSVWGEPLSQTSQSFMPELLFGAKRSLVKARSLLKSLLIIGMFIGLLLGAVATAIPLFVPNIFTSDPAVIGEMRKVWIFFFFAVSVTPCILPCEGTLLAGRDLKFISTSMGACFTFGALVLLIVKSQGLGLVGCWSALVGFQWARFLISLRRILSPSGVLYSEDLDLSRLVELKAA